MSNTILQVTGHKPFLETWYSGGQLTKFPTFTDFQIYDYVYKNYRF
jgi:hypothetical protein